MSYTQAPPNYTGTNAKYTPLATQANDSAAAGPSTSTPLLDGSAQARSEGDIDPDDFKFGVTVEQSSPEVRQMFLKKVYGILFCQLLFTTIVGSTMRIPSIALYVSQNQWIVIASSISALVSMGVLFFKRHSHPANLALLGLFTLLEAVSLGSAIAYVNEIVVLQALIITLFVFGGLTLFVFVYPKIDYSKMAPYLFAGLLFIVGGSFVQLFVPFSNGVDMAMAAGGVVVFSGYILFDTHLITKRLSAEEWVLAVLSLYLDIINLFISIMRILNGTHDD